MTKKNGQNGHHKKKFIEGYILTGTVTHGAEYAGIRRQTVYEWLEKCPAFAVEFEAAKDAVADGLEKEAIRRAQAGSDVLLIFLLKGNKPEKYKDKVQTELSGTTEVTIRVVYDNP